MRRIAVLGSTGSIGTQALDVVRNHRDDYEVVALAAARNGELLRAQAEEFGVPLSSARLCADTPAVLTELASLPEVDVVLNAVVGFAGLPATLAALEHGKRLALANKESLIAGGPVVAAARERGTGEIVPVDSEHSALYQCLRAGRADEVQRLILTASGGPFRGYRRDQLAAVTVADALEHPTWDMGAKITIDSSTLMNKGLEVIEAHELFDVTFDQIDVVVHPQSIVHSMVEFVDGATIAQLSMPDMRLPIGLALGAPARLPEPFGAIDWTKVRQLTFETPDLDAFPCLRLAFEAGRAGGGAPAVLSGANEVAVAAFLDGRIAWTAIASIVAEALDAGTGNVHEVADVLEADRVARARHRRRRPIGPSRMKDPLEEAGVDVNSRVATGMLLAFIAAMVALAVFVPGSRTPLLLVVGIILMVMLHEFGHYWTAKRSGMKVTEFFLGFGPRLWSFTRGETEYGVKAIPAGGYVRIIGMTNMEEVDPADEPRTFRQGTPGKRLAVILAGVTVNLVIAFLLLFVVIAGQGRVGDGPNTTVQTVQADSAAHRGGVETGDKVLAIDGVRIREWDDLKSVVEARGGEEVEVIVARHGEQVALVTTLGVKNGNGFLGVGPGLVIRDVGVVDAVPETFKSMGSIFTGFTDILGDKLSPSGVSTSAQQSFTSATPQVGSSEDLNRPRSLIGIIDTGSDIVGSNMWLLLLLLGQISFILAVFNLLPILPFDGGHAVVVIYEWIASKVKHRRVYADYRKLIPISVVLIIPILFLGLSSMVLDIRQLGQ